MAWCVSHPLLEIATSFRAFLGAWHTAYHSVWNSVFILRYKEYFSGLVNGNRQFFRNVYNRHRIVSQEWKNNWPQAITKVLRFLQNDVPFLWGRNWMLKYSLREFRQTFRSSEYGSGSFPPPTHSSPPIWTAATRTRSRANVNLCTCSPLQVITQLQQPDGCHLLGAWQPTGRDAVTLLCSVPGPSETTPVHRTRGAGGVDRCKTVRERLTDRPRLWVGQYQTLWGVKLWYVCQREWGVWEQGKEGKEMKTN
jgi:hypothetical protein